MVTRIALALLTVTLLVPKSFGAQPEHTTVSGRPTAQVGVETVAKEKEAAETGESPSLLPAADKDTWWAAFWVVIIFVILLIILYFTAWKQVLAGLKSREGRIRKDIADAESSRVKSEAALRDLNGQLASADKKVQELIAKAIADGEKLATSIKMNAQQEAESAKERAQRDIEASKNQAIAEFNTYAANLATDIAGKILRRSLNPEDQKDLVSRSLEQMQTLSKN
jgi:F-type H+-transporting ATPase subunit b